MAVVLAAGYSRRFGAADKRIARLPDGRRLLAAAVARATEAFPRLRVVLREEDDPVALGLPVSTPILRATRAGRGLGASLGEAIAALGRDGSLANVGAAAILLGDMPDIRLETLHALQRQATRSGIVRPCYILPPAIRCSSAVTSGPSSRPWTATTGPGRSFAGIVTAIRSTPSRIPASAGISIPRRSSTPSAASPPPDTQ
ncbi:NTP transferase domain-containing protein [Halomonas sp. M4R5S39]|uniref:NTP transferase domain-containing protein n=1 Tax=Halomonas kalidii TaxID=3043293 RepID=UPI0024A82DCE|nr:NTP transferase domain-containing protein [Halomonas kalidii]MDI5983685.1 NTP transferase domain-containing protein [Halomonas kalidii]